MSISEYKHMPEPCLLIRDELEYHIRQGCPAFDGIVINANAIRPIVADEWGSRFPGCGCLRTRHRPGAQCSRSRTGAEVRTVRRRHTDFPGGAAEGRHLAHRRKTLTRGGENY